MHSMVLLEHWSTNLYTIHVDLQRQSYDIVNIAHDISHCIENLAILKIVVSCTIVVKFNFLNLEVLFSTIFGVLVLIIK